MRQRHGVGLNWEKRHWRLHAIGGKVNAVKFQGILANHLLPVLPRLRPHLDDQFQQDGASYHTARTTMQWLADHDLEVLP